MNTKINKDLYAEINRVKSFLRDANGRARLFIFKNCINLIREIKSYFWGKNDVPTKRDDHALDELRYYIMSKPELPKVYVPKSQIEKDKERLINKLRATRFKTPIKLIK